MSKLFRDLFEQAQAPDPAQAPAPTPAPRRPYRAAIAYAAELHWPVILLEGIKCIDGKGYCTCGKADCPSPGKHPPAGEPGVSGATTDLALIKTRFGARPWANVGIATGAILGLDVDPRHGGDRSLTALERVHGPLPVTVTAHRRWRAILFRATLASPQYRQAWPWPDAAARWSVAPAERARVRTIYEWLRIATSDAPSRRCRTGSWAACSPCAPPPTPASPPGAAWARC